MIYDNFFIHIDMFYYSIFKLHLTLLNLHSQSHESCFTNVLALFLFVIILNTPTLMSFAFFGTRISGDKIQFPLCLSKLIMNG